MSKEPIIETDRLILRPLTLDDAEACYSWNSDERVTKYMSCSTYTNISQTIDWIKSTFADENEWLRAFVKYSAKCPNERLLAQGILYRSDVRYY